MVVPTHPHQVLGTEAFIKHAHQRMMQLVGRFIDPTLMDGLVLSLAMGKVT